MDHPARNSTITAPAFAPPRGQANDLFHVTDTAGNLLDRAAADRLSTALAHRLIQAERGSPRGSPERA